MRHQFGPFTPGYNYRTHAQEMKALRCLLLSSCSKYCKIVLMTCIDSLLHRPKPLSSTLPPHAMGAVSQNSFYLQEGHNINISQTRPTPLALLVSNRKVAKCSCEHKSARKLHITLTKKPLQCCLFQSKIGKSNDRKKALTATILSRFVRMAVLSHP